VSVQWLYLGAEETLIASSTGAWIQRAALGRRPFAGDMSDSVPATVESTRHLLDGAIAAAEKAIPRVQGPPMSRWRWAWSLVNQWYGAHHSLPLFLEVADRFTAIDRPDLAEFAVEKYEEERGHDELPLNDLRMLSYDAEAAVSEVTPDPGVVELVEYAHQCVRGDQPVEFLGHIYALERQMIRLDSGFFAALDAALGCDRAPASFLRSHANDLDIGHVEEAVSFITGLPASDRTAVARSCYRTTQIRHVSLPGRYPSESELESRLSRFQTAFAHQPQGEQQ
jgi:heme oxygenase-like protein